MLRKKALNRIYLTTIVLFIMVISFTFELLTPEKNTNLEEIEYVSNLNTVHIYLLNNDNYLVKVDILINEDTKEKKALEILNNLYVDNKKYSNLKGIIPSNTKINNITFNDETLTVDFSSDLLKVNKALEEKVIESIVYSLLEIKDVKNVTIKIDGKVLNKLEKSNKNLPVLLNSTFGINKDYDITSIKDCQRVTLYYVFNNSNNDYFVPVTKYINSKESKIKIIIDSLKGNYIGNTTLSSYLNQKTDIKDFSIDEDILTITFNSLNDLNLESVIYSLASSIFDSMNIEKVIFTLNDQVIDIKTKN